MRNTMRRRGPDQKGVWVKHGTALLHNRLAVIDIEGGRQPMRREHAVIVYNGELYNTAEVRTDLAKQGYVFSTHSDTEVVLTAYLAWGEACLERLNGIYAFAVWDMQKQELFFARDRIGVKPFFFTEKNGTFLFASEIKTLLAHPDISAEIDGNGISELVLLGPGERRAAACCAACERFLPVGAARIRTEQGFGCGSIGIWRIRSTPIPNKKP